MAEEDNLVIRMLREIRSDLHDVRADTSETRARMTRVERRIDELHEGMVVALGTASLAQLAVENHGQHFDEIRDEIDALKRRVTELEARA